MSVSKANPGSPQVCVYTSFWNFSLWTESGRIRVSLCRDRDINRALAAKQSELPLLLFQILWQLRWSQSTFFKNQTEGAH